MTNTDCDGTENRLIVAARSGWTPAELRTARKAGRISRLRRGIYTSASDWRTASSDARNRARILAVLEQRADAVLTSFSAAAMLGLPIIGEWPDDVFLLSNRTSGRRRNGVIELSRRGDELIVSAGEVAMTSVPRTLVQVARRAPLVTALAMMDAALHVDRYGRREPMCTIEELRAEHAAMLPYPRSARVRLVLERATSLADSAFETLSRVSIEEIGFPEPELQHRVWLPRSQREVFLDFAWPEYAIGGEADGEGKYRVPADRSAADAVEILVREKRRENEVLGQQWKRIARWDWSEALRRRPLRTILLEAGLPIIRRPRTFV
jgi:hypothetical protein